MKSKLTRDIVTFLHTIPIHTIKKPTHSGGTYRHKYNKMDFVRSYHITKYLFRYKSIETNSYCSQRIIQKYVTSLGGRGSVQRSTKVWFWGVERLGYVSCPVFQKIILSNFEFISTFDLYLQWNLSKANTIVTTK